MKKYQALGLALLWLSVAPAWAQTTSRTNSATTSKPKPAATETRKDEEKVQTDATNPQRRALQDTDVEFLDSQEAYWVTKGYNDMMYGAGGSYNAVRLEREQGRDEEIFRKLYKPTQVVDIVVKGKLLNQAPTFRIEGRKIEAPKP